MMMGGVSSAHRDMRIRRYKILLEKSVGKRPLGLPGRRWKDNIEMDIREIRFGVCGFISLGSGQRPALYWL